eukprot:s591_g4.t1
MTPAEKEQAEKSWRAALEERRKMREWAERVGFQGCPSSGNPMRYHAKDFVEEVPFTVSKPSEKWHPDDMTQVEMLLKRFEWHPGMTWNPFRETTDTSGIAVHSDVTTTEPVVSVEQRRKRRKVSDC